MPTSITSNGITFDDTTTLTTGVLPTANIANAAVTPAKLSQPLTLATSVSTTSGTSIDFTGIPSWVKRITVMLNGVSTNGSSIMEIRLGSGSIASSGYSGSQMFSAPTTNGGTLVTTGFGIAGGAAGNIRHGNCVITNISGNTWVASCVGGYSDQAATWHGGGSVTLSGTLDRIRLTTVNGTDTFDAGSVNIIYEG